MVHSRQYDNSQTNGFWVLAHFRMEPIDIGVYVSKASNGEVVSTFYIGNMNRHGFQIAPFKN